MSLINQVLLDLEKRRASSVERGALPDHVRALPEMRDRGRMWWLAGIGAVLVIVLGIALVIYLKSRAQPTANVMPSPAAPVQPPVAVQAPPVSPPPQPQAPAAAPDTAVAQSQSIAPPAASAPGTAVQAVAPPQQGPDKPSTAPAAPPIPTSQVIGKPAPQAPPAPAVSAPAAPPAATAAATGPAAPSPQPTAPAATPAPPAAKETAPPAPSASSRSEPVQEEARARGRASAKKAAKAPPPPARTTAKERAAGPSEIEKEVRKLTPQQQLEAEYEKAAAFMNQGRLGEARELLEAVLRSNPAHQGARQTLIALLISSNLHGDAERTLQEALKVTPTQSGYAMQLARLQMNRGDVHGAIETLQRSVEHGQDNADNLGFLAALLQRQQRHPEAVERFQGALRLKPQNGVWLMGLGISLQALNRDRDAQEAYRRAKASGLSPELQAFVDQRLRQLQ